MKTLGIALLVIGSVVGITGVVMKPEKQMYSALFTVEIPPPMEIHYSGADDDGAIAHWTHCSTCKQGVIRKDGSCSYCGQKGQAN